MISHQFRTFRFNPIFSDSFRIFPYPVPADSWFIPIYSDFFRIFPIFSELFLWSRPLAIGAWPAVAVLFWFNLNIPTLKIFTLHGNLWECVVHQMLFTDLFRFFPNLSDFFRIIPNYSPISPPINSTMFRFNPIFSEFIRFFPNLRYCTESTISHQFLTFRFNPIFSELFPNCIPASCPIIPIYSDLFRFIPIFSEFIRFFPNLQYCTESNEDRSAIDAFVWWFFRFIPIFSDLFRFFPIFSEFFRIYPIFPDPPNSPNPTVPLLFASGPIYSDLIRFFPIFSEFFGFMPKKSGIFIRIYSDLIRFILDIFEPPKVIDSIESLEYFYSDLFGGKGSWGGGLVA